MKWIYRSEKCNVGISFTYNITFQLSLFCPTRGSKSETEYNIGPMHMQTSRFAKHSSIVWLLPVFSLCCDDRSVLTGSVKYKFRMS